MNRLFLRYIDGRAISPVLANFALDGLEAALHAQFPKPRRRLSPLVNLIRYADDFVITGRTKELLENEVKPFVEHYFSSRGLELSQEKTKITHINEGFDFLGQNVRKYNGKLLIKPSKANVKTFLDKVRKVIRANRQATAGDLIAYLNPMIRGWATYHRHVVSSHQFSEVDSAIFRMLWRWALRRHRHKSKRWIRNKYFGTFGQNTWVFQGKFTKPNGITGTARLFYAASVAIKRHIKVRGAANPYDPVWEAYFERRLDAKMQATFRGQQRLLSLWRQQGGICPVCKQMISDTTGWHNHHIVWRVHGGADTMENCVLLHPNCHRQVHSQKLEVVKPRLN